MNSAQDLPPWDDFEEQPFTCEVAISSGRAWARPTGELDLATVPTLDAQLERLAGEGHRALGVDLSELTFIDSSGLHLLMKWSQRASEEGIDFELIPGRRAVQRVFSLAGVAHLLPFARSDLGAEDARADEL